MPEKLETPTRLDPIRRALLEGEVIESLRTVYDPEIPVNVYDLGLIYEIEVGEFGDVKVQMTLTSPACPVAGTLPGEVEQKVRETAGVRSAEVELVWDPPYSMDRMPDHIKLELGLL
ncbi:MAG TPA: SUF system Fe-S cluster assembly protein [Fimbriimonadaceae bacterium]|nr:SUF system Fe-S cluster assembly protein [Fimbriimonadaceae bacterium]